MLKAFGVMLAWAFVTAPMIGIVAACVTGFALAALFELVKFVRDVIRIHRDPLGALSPTDYDLSKFR